ncbi:MAG: hypothetical protein HON90_04870 [Halobacteriovoraceae bacterium]|jgi:TatD DNase family protein|nr:hypothetical protein [Halobacteriovoraceae bacterium]
MNKFLNLHTHHLTNCPHTHEVYQLSLTEKIEPLPSYFSYGIHPWEVGNHNFNKFSTQLKKYSPNPGFVGLGEIGLDKTCDKDFNLQRDVFKKQISLAIELDISVIILHCVRSYQECIQDLKKLNYTGNIVIHGYRSNAKVYQQFCRHFSTYISLSADALNTTKMLTLIKEVPLNKIFLETDNSIETDIEENYKALSKILNLDLQTIKKTLETNFTKLRNS